MTDEKLVELINESRFISASENVLFPLIEKFVQQRLDGMIAKFNGGETNFISDVAYISGLRSLAQNLKSKQTVANKKLGELHGRE